MTDLLDKIKNVEETLEAPSEKRLQVGRARSEEIVHWKRWAKVKSNFKESILQVSELLSIEIYKLDVCTKYLDTADLKRVENLAPFLNALITNADELWKSSPYRGGVRIMSSESGWLKFVLMRPIRKEFWPQYKNSIETAVQALLKKENEFQPVAKKVEFESKKICWVCYNIEFSIPELEIKKSQTNKKKVNDRPQLR